MHDKRKEKISAFCPDKRRLPKFKHSFWGKGFYIIDARLCIDIYRKQHYPFIKLNNSHMAFNIKNKFQRKRKNKSCFSPRIMFFASRINSQYIIEILSKLFQKLVTVESTKTSLNYTMLFT